MTTLIRSLSVDAVAVLVLLSQAIAAPTENGVSHVRTSNARVSEVFRHAMARSASFRDLVATFEVLDRVVYVEEGTCPPPEPRACLHMVRSPHAKVLVVQLATRQPINAVVEQLAHELYHAVEIAREPSVVDAGSMRQLFERIGYRNCMDANATCWETRAAVAFEQLVARQLAERAPGKTVTGTDGRR
jgi:hypothetical protein